jgi:hypothetical protein
VAKKCKENGVLRIILYAIVAIIGYALIFCLIIGSVVGFFQILKWVFN